MICKLGLSAFILTLFAICIPLNPQQFTRVAPCYLYWQSIVTVIWCQEIFCLWFWSLLPKRENLMLCNDHYLKSLTAAAAARHNLMSWSLLLDDNFRDWEADVRPELRSCLPSRVENSLWGALPPSSISSSRSVCFGGSRTAFLAASSRSSCSKASEKVSNFPLSVL